MDGITGSGPVCITLYNNSLYAKTKYDENKKDFIK